MDSDLGFGYSHSHRQKRSHAQMEHEGSSPPSWPSLRRLSVSREPSSAGSPSHPHVSGLHLPRITNMPPVQPRRFVGDGLDLRRPASLSRNDTVIDLTADDAGPGPSASSSRPPIPRPQRLPRFQREIIDISEEVPRSNTPPDSPEIEFISARRVEGREQEPPRFHHGDGGDNEVEFVRSNRLPEDRRRNEIAARQHHLENMMAGMIGDVFGDDLGPHHNRLAYLRAHFNRAANSRPPVVPPRARPVVSRTRIHFGFAAPDLNFEMVGFDMGMGGGREPPPPTYDAPSPAPDGFTRSPNEEDALICPNCEDELCMGDSDVKKQVWIVKGCGHAYCGECATNRYSKRSAKGKEKVAPVDHKPFKECVIDGCNKRTSGQKAMIQVFL